MDIHRALVRAIWTAGLLIGTAAWGRGGPEVLHLNSYHHGLGWSDQIMDGLKSTMGPHEQVAVEFLDSKHAEDPALDSAMAQVLRIRYGGGLRG